MKKILFCGGGSAGHVVPNIALCRDLKDKYVCEYAGTDGIEYGICRREGVKFYRFDGVKLIRGRVFANLTLPFKLVRATKQAKAILRLSAPDAVFCKGGYVSLPPALAAKKLDIPIFTHESDLSAGLANKIISRISVKTFTSFPETAKKFKNGVYTGSPLCAENIGGDRQSAIQKLGLDGRRTVLVFGGGSGSAVINGALRKILPELCKSCNVLHACGKGNAVQNNVYGYRQSEYITDMRTAYAAADCAIARCGSNSAFELIANKIPTLFIPLENKASRGDQLQNALYFKEKGLCRILRQAELTPAKLLQEIENTLNDEDLKTNLEKSKITSGNARIIQEITRTIGE